MGLKLKRGNGSDWTSNNPILEPGEIGIEQDATPVKFKIGDGATAWNSLAYFGGVLSGSAGGDLMGTYPNPTIANGVITAAKISATLDQIPTPVANVGMGSHNIINVLDPTSAQHAATKNYVDTRKVTDLTAPTTDFSMNSHKVTNVLDPTVAQDAATKAYVDANAGVSSVNTKTGAVTLVASDVGAVSTSDSRLTDARIGKIPNWTASTVYKQYQLVRNSNVIYRANADFTSGASFNAANWTALAPASNVTLNGIASPTTDYSMSSHKLTNVLDPTSSQDAATKNYIDTRTINTLAAPTADFSMSTHKITNVVDPTSAQDVATKAYVDANAGGGAVDSVNGQTGTVVLSASDVGADASGAAAAAQSAAEAASLPVGTTLDDIALPAGPVNMNNQKINNLAAPDFALNAANKSYVDGMTVNTLTAPTADFSMNTHKITNVVDPTGAQDAATKNYIDTRTPGVVAQSSAPSDTSVIWIDTSS